MLPSIPPCAPIKVRSSGCVGAPCDLTELKGCQIPLCSVMGMREALLVHAFGMLLFVFAFIAPASFEFSTIFQITRTQGMFCWVSRKPALVSVSWGVIEAPGNHLYHKHLF